MNAKFHYLLDAVYNRLLDVAGIAIVLFLKYYLPKRLQTSAGPAFQVREAIKTKEEEEKMEKIILDGKELDVKLVFADGKLSIEAVDEGKQGGGTLKLYISTDALLDKLAAAIPGTLDDMIIGVAKEALKKI